MAPPRVQPVALADNPDAWLDFTDLVFVDPVATGYSRSAAGTDEADKAFFGVEKDADAMADFVRLTLSRAGRTLAPVFLAGESYGGFRVALLAHRLISGGIAVKGVVMISPALEFSMLRGNPYVPLPLALVLPSIAATHLERRDGAEGSLAILPEVERFARSGYLVHLAAGVEERRGHRPHARALHRAAAGRDPRPDEPGVGAHLHARIREARRPRAQPLRRHRQRPGAAPQRDPLRSYPGWGRDGADARLHAIRPRPSSATAPTWSTACSIARSADAGISAPRRRGRVSPARSTSCRPARTHNPALGVLVTHGYTDLVTPYGVSQYLIDQMAPLEGARPVELKLYRGGHMMYLRPASRRALTQDARAFYRSVLKGP